MSDKAHVVSSACALCYAPKKPCNFFVRDVASKVGVTLPSHAGADELLKAASNHWQEISASQATLAAERGFFVIAGMRSDEFGKPESHGHVAVVLPGKIGNYPRVAATNDSIDKWGKSKGDAPLSHVFPAKDVQHGKVRYFAPPRGASGSW